MWLAWLQAKAIFGKGIVHTPKNRGVAIRYMSLREAKGILSDRLLQLAHSHHNNDGAPLENQKFGLTNSPDLVDH